MGNTVNIGIIGDYDGRPSHLATNDGLRHSANLLSINMEIQWLPTDSLETNIGQRLSGYDGLWCAPGSPYKSMAGALNAIRFARENDIPFIGTCGGFQHAVIEYAQNKLGISDAQHAAVDPGATNLFITALSCSLAGETRELYFMEGSRAFGYYGQASAVERYNCSFGLNPEYQKLLDEDGFKVAGTDETREARVLELPQHRFYVATLFVPQMSSTVTSPHKLITAFLASAKEHGCQGSK